MTHTHAAPFKGHSQSIYSTVNIYSIWTKQRRKKKPQRRRGKKNTHISECDEILCSIEGKRRDNMFDDCFQYTIY